MISTVVINPKKNDREKIISLLSSSVDIKVLAHGKDGYDALKLIGKLKPDIAILDNNLEFIEGEEISPLLKARSNSTAVVILIAKISDYQLYRAASNKISGLVHKDTEMDKLPEIIKWIHKENCYISPFFATRVMQLLATNKNLTETSAKQEEKILYSTDPTGYLSKMELQILTCIGEGFTSGEIAKKLSLAVGTVRNYISSIMRKTGLNSRSQMVRYSFQYGLVSLRFDR